MARNALNLFVLSAVLAIALATLPTHRVTPASGREAHPRVIPRSARAATSRRPSSARRTTARLSAGRRPIAGRALRRRVRPRTVARPVRHTRTRRAVPSRQLHSRKLPPSPHMLSSYVRTLVPGGGLQTSGRFAIYTTVGRPGQIRGARRGVDRASKNVERRRSQLLVAKKRAARPRASKRDLQRLVKAKTRLAKALALLSKREARLRKLLKKKPIRPNGKKTERINGQLLPRTCWCRLAKRGNGRCFDFVAGSDRYCEARPCAARYACTSKRRSRGSLCYLRRVDTQIVPDGARACVRKPVRSYMFVPYAGYA